MAVAFVASHYDAREYSVHDEQEYLNRICEMTGVPAMSVAIMDNDAEIYLNYSCKHDVPIDEQSFYELASMTKAFTALGILQLEKDGKLKLTDPVDQYISWFQPKFKGKSATITIEQLLEHTNGIPEWTICLIPYGTQDNSDLYQVIERIKNIKLNHEPGKVHEYATINLYAYDSIVFGRFQVFFVLPTIILNYPPHLPTFAGFRQVPIVRI